MNGLQTFLAISIFIIVLVLLFLILKCICGGCNLASPVTDINNPSDDPKIPKKFYAGFVGLNLPHKRRHRYHDDINYVANDQYRIDYINDEDTALKDKSSTHDDHKIICEDNESDTDKKKCYHQDGDKGHDKNTDIDNHEDGKEVGNTTYHISHWHQDQFGDSKSSENHTSTSAHHNIDSTHDVNEKESSGHHTSDTSWGGHHNSHSDGGGYHSQNNWGGGHDSGRGGFHSSWGDHDSSGWSGGGAGDGGGGGDYGGGDNSGGGGDSGGGGGD